MYGREVRWGSEGVGERRDQGEEVGGHGLTVQLRGVALKHFPPICALVELRQSRSKGGGRDERP